MVVRLTEIDQVLRAGILEVMGVWDLNISDLLLVSNFSQAAKLGQG